MKLLLDLCVSPGAAETLRARGHDVQWVGDWDTVPGDAAILALAALDGRIVVTLDKDFGELAVLRKLPHAGIVRIVGVRARAQADMCLAVLSRCQGDLEAGALITAEPGRVRIRARSE